MSDPTPATSRPEPGVELATTADEVYANRPFAGTVFRRARSKRQYLATIDEADPIPLSKAVEEIDGFEGSIEIETGEETIELDVGTTSEPKRQENGQAKTKEEWIEVGKAKKQEEAQKKVDQVHQRYEERLEARDEKIDALQERVGSLRDQLQEVRRRKNEEIEREQEKRREKVDRLETKYREEIKELEDKIRDLKDERIDERAQHELSTEQSPVEMVLSQLAQQGEMSDLMSLLTQAVQAFVGRLSGGPVPQLEGYAQNGAAGQQAARQNARRNGAATATQEGPSTTERTVTPEPPDRQTTDRDTTERQGPPGEEPPNEPPHAGDDGPQEDDEVSLVSPQKKMDLVYQAVELLVAGKEDAFQHLILFDEADLLERFQLGDWVQTLEALARTSIQNGVRPQTVGEALGPLLTDVVPEDGHDQLRRASQMPAKMAAELLFQFMEDEVGGETVDFVRRAIETLQEGEYLSDTPTES